MPESAAHDFPSFPKPLPIERRFVVLEHEWSGTHWDFNVEIAPGGPLRTWAIDARPDSGPTLPARALPDHRREYLTYEGEISGGRGAVKRWDEGTCLVEVWETDRVRLILNGRQLTGPVELLLSPDGGASGGTGPASGAGGGSAPSWTFRRGKLS